MLSILYTLGDLVQNNRRGVGTIIVFFKTMSVNSFSEISRQQGQDLNPQLSDS